MLLRRVKGGSLLEDSMFVHGIKWVCVFAYFDETGTDGKSPIVAMSGYLFSSDGAFRFDDLYRQRVVPMLPPEANGIFHASHCMAQEKKFTSISKTHAENILCAMADAIEESVHFGVTILIERSDYEQAKIAQANIEELSGTPYAVCALSCIDDMNAWMDKEKISEGVEYIFEMGHEREAREMLDRIGESQQLRTKYRWTKYGFAEKGSSPQLCAPDLLAWEQQYAYKVALMKDRRPWRMTLSGMVGAKPHITRFLSPIRIGGQGMMNMMYGLIDPPSEIEL
jgi:hypothetical protein